MLTHIPRENRKEVYTRDRWPITEVLNRPNSPDLSIARCRVEPGVTTELHRLLDTRETYVIETGQGVMDDGSDPAFPVNVGDAVVIPANRAQRITNTGTTDLVFLVYCQPRFEPRSYDPLEPQESG